MTQQTINIPALRFPEFKGEWVTHRLGDFIEEFKEKTKTPDEYEVFTSARSGLVRQIDYYGENRLTERDNIGFNIIPPNYITYRSRSDDRCFYFNENKLGQTGIVSIYYPVFRIINGDNKFFVELFYQKSHLIGRYSVGTSQTVLSLNELREIKLPIPSVDEQNKIAEMLVALDLKINQLERKKGLLEDYKKGCVEKLFSQELRFSNNKGEMFADWKQVRLGDIVKFYKGRGISKENISATGNIPCIRYGELYTHYGQHISKPLSRTDVPVEQLFLSNAGDVIMPSSGESAIDIATAACVEDAGVALGGDLNVLRWSGNGLFLAYYLTYHKRREIAQSAQGVSVVHLYADALRVLSVHIPGREEQQRIAAFIKSLDQKIELASEQIEKANLFKKGLLQEIFI